MTINEAISYADGIKKNNFSKTQKVQWLNEIEGYVQIQIMLLAQPECRKYYSDSELKVRGIEFPSDDTLVSPRKISAHAGGLLSLSGLVDFEDNNLTDLEVISISDDRRTLKFRAGTFQTGESAETAEATMSFDGGDTELLVPAPYEKLYYEYLLCKLSEHLEESAEQNNRLSTFKDTWENFAAWYARTYHPADQKAVWRGYYIKGPQGERGAQGVSPTVTVEDIEGGHRITITDAEGPHSFDFVNGEDVPEEIWSAMENKGFGWMQPFTRVISKGEISTSSFDLGGITMRRAGAIPSVIPAESDGMKLTVNGTDIAADWIYGDRIAAAAAGEHIGLICRAGDVELIVQGRALSGTASEDGVYLSEGVSAWSYTRDEPTIINKMFLPNGGAPNYFVTLGYDQETEEYYTTNSDEEIFAAEAAGLNIVIAVPYSVLFGSSPSIQGYVYAYQADRYRIVGGYLYKYTQWIPAPGMELDTDVPGIWLTVLRNRSARNYWDIALIGAADRIDSEERTYGTVAPVFPTREAVELYVKNRTMWVYLSYANGAWTSDKSYDEIKAALDDLRPIELRLHKPEYSQGTYTVLRYAGLESTAQANSIEFSGAVYNINEGAAINFARIIKETDLETWEVKTANVSTLIEEE